MFRILTPLWLQEQVTSTGEVVSVQTARFSSTLDMVSPLEMTYCASLAMLSTMRRMACHLKVCLRWSQLQISPVQCAMLQTKLQFSHCLEALYVQTAGIKSTVAMLCLDHLKGVSMSASIKPLRPS